jgi:UDP-3-O-[3-hydroxymyristoyl] N-acetylglucosamine deacetylase
MMQHTLQSSIEFNGVGLHSGHDICMVLHPAPASHGIVFKRTDVSDQDNLILAQWDKVVDTQLCTVIGNADGITVGTVEHLMAALRGCGVDNVLVEINGPEVPVMDGSSVTFVEHIEEQGLVKQDVARRFVKVLKSVSVEEDGKLVSLHPGDIPSFEGAIEFDHPVIGHQSHAITLVNGNFKHDLASARTFGFLREVEYLRSNGLALGGSLDNAIVLDDERVMNAQGLRYDDEFIRHKLLDAIGDLYLAGCPIQGTYKSHKSSHALNNKLLRKLFATDGAWEYVDPSA